MNNLDPAFATSFSTIDLADLDAVNGGFDFGRMVDNGNRYGTAGAMVGGGIGAVAGGVAAGAPTAGAAAVPGALAGAGIGGAIGGGLGWLGGATGDAIQQLRGK